MAKSKSASATGVDALFTLDTTGSMYPCLTQARRSISQTARRLFKDIPGLRIGIIAHGDYCDVGRPYVTKALDFSSDQDAICRFVEKVEPTGGGDAPECYELVLNEARALSWRAGATKVLSMVGDDVPHPPTDPQNRKRIDWRNELELLLEAGIHVYGVHAMPGVRSHSRSFYEEIARRTGGYYLTLDQFAAITDIILAVCYKQSSPEQLTKFRDEVQAASRMDRGLRRVFQTLSGEKLESTERRDGLEPVPAGRFQMLRVDEKQAIKKFVEAQGLRFNKGRGFYEFTKTETIQENKEVVLVERATGDMFSGDEARELIGLPRGMRGRVRPAALDEYVVFVQSTSYTRALVGGTRFLYEVEDWDRSLAAA